MGMPEQSTERNLGYVYTGQQCPKYNWQKMDAFERVGVNMMDAVGAKNAVFGSMFGLFIFAIVVFFFRKQMATFLTEGVFRGGSRTTKGHK